MLQVRELSAQSVNTYVSAVQFLYLETLSMPWKKDDFPRTRTERKLPVVLSPDQVRRLFDFVPGVKNRAALMLCFGAGLRVSEAAAFRAANIDSARMLLRVQLGKGRKDRYTMLSPGLLEVLRLYWRVMRPAGEWLLPSWHPSRHISPGVLQRACREAWQLAGLPKRVTPHTLRHSFATCLLDSGVDTRIIQVLLGHDNIETTARYIAVSPSKIAATVSPAEQLLAGRFPKTRQQIARARTA